MSNTPGNENAPGQNKAHTIIINTRSREVSGQRITYEEVVALAFPGSPPGEAVSFTVSFANPHGKDGTLVAGQDTKIQEGMIFNVTKTNRS